MTEPKARVGWNVGVASLWLVTLVTLVLSTAGDGDAYSDRVAWARILGWHSSGALVAALCVKPGSRWLPRLRETSKLRRALGLAAAVSAIIHALVTVGGSPLTIAQQLQDAHLRFGFGALIVFLLLGLTSFPSVVARLHLRSWKELHRLVYVAWLCAVLHALLSPYAWMPGVLGLSLVVIGAGLTRLVPRGARSQ